LKYRFTISGGLQEKANFLISKGYMPPEIIYSNCGGS